MSTNKASNYEIVYTGNETKIEVTDLQSATTYYFRLASALNASTFITGIFSEATEYSTSGMDFIFFFLSLSIP